MFFEFSIIPRTGGRRIGGKNNIFRGSFFRRHRVNLSTIRKVPFPRRFLIIRYLVRVPFSRSYVTHRRVSVGVVLKRFMNYVDRSACGRSLYTPVARSPAERFWTVGRMLFTGYGFDGWIYAARKGVTLYPLYQAGIVVVSSSFTELFVLFAIGSRICVRALRRTPLGVIDRLRNRTGWIKDGTISI